MRSRILPSLSGRGGAVLSHGAGKAAWPVGPDAGVWPLLALPAFPWPVTGPVSLLHEISVSVWLFFSFPSPKPSCPAFLHCFFPHLSFILHSFTTWALHLPSLSSPVPLSPPVCHTHTHPCPPFPSLPPSQKWPIRAEAERGPCKAGGPWPARSQVPHAPQPGLLSPGQVGGMPLPGPPAQHRPPPRLRFPLPAHPTILPSGAAPCSFLTSFSSSLSLIPSQPSLCWASPDAHLVSGPGGDVHTCVPACVCPCVSLCGGCACASRASWSGPFPLLPTPFSPFPTPSLLPLHLFPSLSTFLPHALSHTLPLPSPLFSFLPCPLLPSLWWSGSLALPFPGSSPARSLLLLFPPLPPASCLLPGPAPAGPPLCPSGFFPVVWALPPHAPSCLFSPGLFLSPLSPL
nr:uncharacterized protein LOC111763300 isoform X1 [Dasypus novemcinctus]